MSENKQLAINIVASILVMMVSLGINFFLSPYIVENVGLEAYGFIQLANNFISYFTIITIAINSMSSRFISVEFFRNNYTDANKYYSSTFFANLLVCTIFLPIVIIGIINMDLFVMIPANIEIDVKFLMLFLFISFFIKVLATNLQVPYYVTKKLYISSANEMMCSVLQGIILLLLYMLFRPRIAYVGLAGLVLVIVKQIINLYYKNRLTPQLKIKKEYYSKAKIFELVSAGIWRSITSIGNMLSTGLDLLLTNVLISAADMGVLAITKVIPNFITNLLYSIIKTFAPQMTELYANNQIDELVVYIKRSMKIIGVIMNIPLAGIIVFGDVFFSLWQPSQDPQLLQVLSIITIIPWIILGQIVIIHNLFTVLNKIKINSILVTITGLLNVIIVYILLKNTCLGLFAVAGVSSVLSILRNLLYTVPYGAIYLKRRWYTFFPEYIRSIGTVFVLSIIGYVIRLFMWSISWFSFIIFVLITCIVGILFNYFIVLNREDRVYIKKVLQNYISRRKSQNG